MTMQEFTYSIAFSLLISFMPANNGQGQDSTRVEVSTVPVIPEAIKRKIDQIKKKAVVEDSIINRLDKPVEIIEKAAQETVTSSVVLDNTSRRLDRLIAVVKPVKAKSSKLVITTEIRYKEPVPVTITESKPVVLPEICPEDTRRVGLFKRLFPFLR